MAPKSKSRFDFVYQERDPDETRKMARETGKKYEAPYKSGFDIFTPKIGTNNIRILPPSWGSAKHYGYLIYVHRYVGAAGATFLCPNMMNKGKCPCCEAWKQAKESGDDEEARAMFYSVQMVYWIIDRDGSDDIPQLYTISKVRDSEIIELSEDQQTHKLLRIDHPEEGYDISFKRTGKGKTDTKYIGTRVARNASQIHPDEDTQESILKFISENPIPSVLLFRDYKFINAAISGTAEEKDEDLDQADEVPWTESKTRPKARAAEPEDEEDSEEAPARTATRSRRPVEDDEDEADEAPPPIKKTARAPVEEDEEDAEDLPQARKPAKPLRAVR